MKQLYSFLRPHRGNFLLALLCLLFQSAGVLYLPSLVADIINIGVANSDLNYIYKTGILMLIVVVISGVGAVLSTFYSAQVMSRLCGDMREAVFLKAMSYSRSDFQKIGTASMITRCTSDITIIQRTGGLFLRIMLPVPIMMVVGFSLSFSTNARLAWMLLCFIAFFLLAAILIGRKAIPMFETLQVKMDRLTYILREKITGTRVIRAFNRQNFEQERFYGSCRDFRDIAVQINRIFAILIPVLFLLLDMCVVFILWFGGIEVTKGTLQIGSIFALIEYMTIILFSGVMGALVFMEIPRAMACLHRINAVLNLESSLSDTDHIPEIQTRGSLEFRNVSFRYPGAEEPVLNNISFTAHSGQITAVIGSTGSGKSTLANLIPRFYGIQEGEILLDGVNIEQYPQKVLRDKIGFIPQKGFLFRGTIEDNIRFGKPDASMEEVRHAAEIAQAHSFISELEGGYEAYVAQGGTNLSGGQRQRVAIARALVKRPEVHVFDDSFSALDFQTDAMLRHALKKEVQNSILVIVAQRISTIMDADQIIVLEEGKMAGIGTHSELMENCAIYRQIAVSQLSEEELRQEGVL
ncbi:ABC transporter ATP-binding protein [Faecalicatena contorta]|uniref:ATP-binding cassette, subfamily B n=1 Tax=Faecalicatena contorta TaxID=39482 RepID=A0A316A2B3_9FIRM|nr:ABC transporter ATP-binding protein [Faecalicatena contorta]PWJ51692.1 ATP-binding cassette subfamily B protein [Faecalicatena contorta]SUQ13248.1 ATP-binding cassette, subfamily B [Faecalicatena contorta]